MVGSTTLKIRSKGTITLPIELRRKYGLDEGGVISVVDLGGGALLLTPIITQVDRLGDRVAKAIEEAGVSGDEILASLDEERERYYQERYADD